MFDIEKSHFSFFDLFAYIIPGAIGMMIILIFTNLWCVTDPNIEVWVEIIEKGINAKSVTFMDSIWFILLTYILGHITSFLSSISIEAYSHWRYKYPSDFLMLRSPLQQTDLKKNNGYDSNSPYNWLTLVLQIIISIIIMPVSLLELFFGELLKCKYYYLKPLDKIYTDVIDIRISTLMTLLQLAKKEEFKDDNNDALVDSDFHRIAYHYEKDKLTAHKQNFEGYIALYDFHRALSLIFVFAFWFYLYFIISHAFYSCEAILIGVILFILPYLFFIMFMKFYRRLTLETFMYLITDCDLCDK